MDLLGLGLEGDARALPLEAVGERGVERPVGREGAAVAQRPGDVLALDDDRLDVVAVDLVEELADRVRRLAAPRTRTLEDLVEGDQQDADDHPEGEVLADVVHAASGFAWGCAPSSIVGPAVPGASSPGSWAAGAKGAPASGRGGRNATITAPTVSRPPPRRPQNRWGTVTDPSRWRSAGRAVSAARGKAARRRADVPQTPSAPTEFPSLAPRISNRPSHNAAPSRSTAAGASTAAASRAITIVPCDRSIEHPPSVHRRAP